MKKKKKCHFVEQFQIPIENRRNRQNRYPYNTNTRPLTLLSWYRHFNKKAAKGDGVKLV